MINLTVPARARAVGICCALTFSTLITPAYAGDKVADEVWAQVRAQWASEMAGAPMSEQMSTVAADYTEFNGGFATRIDGKDLNSRVYEAQIKDGTLTLIGEPVNGKVQVYGDVAIATYNYLGVTKSKDGKTEAGNGKSTRVYAKQGGKWMLVHAHFSPVSVGD